MIWQRRLVSGFVAVLCVLPTLVASAPGPEVRGILAKHCVACHGAEAQNANVRLDTLTSDPVRDRRAAETWHDVRNALNAGLMPPQGAVELSAADRKTLLDWLDTTLRQSTQAFLGSDSVRIRRLNRVEYQNTMRALLGLDIDYIKDLPPDEVSSDGFTNNGRALRMSDQLLEHYLKAARDGLARAIIQGPAPPVHSHSATETVVDKVRTQHWSNRLGRTGTFVARVPEFPNQGSFEIRVRARAEAPDGAPHPRMHVSMGYRADTLTPSRTVAEVDVIDSASRVFEFRGRIGEYPIQSRTQSKYPGLLVWIRNVYSDGQPPPDPRTVPIVVDGKKKDHYVWDEDPTFPKIVIESIDFRAPAYMTWPPVHHTSLVPVTPTSRSDEPKAVAAALRKFMGRAYRRPVRDADLRPVMRFYRENRETVDSFEEALRETMAMVLISPDFLYRVEGSPKGRRLSSYQIASRLSYFLWSSMPSQRLLDLAGRDALRNPDTLRLEALRMLEDPRSRALVDHFSDQWLDLQGVHRVAINPNYYPDFDLRLKGDMRRETQEYFATLLAENRSALEFLRSDFTMLNERLARHYGLDGPRGGTFERVALDASNRRGGLLTHGSILLSNSTGEDSHPVERGVWIRRALLNDPPASPPPAVPNLTTTDADFALLPLRRQLEMHQDSPACAHCHQGIDPWGVALEAFDAVGLRRSEVRRRFGAKLVTHPVDAAAVLPDGHAVHGADELSDYLLKEQGTRFARGLASKLLAYALGRSLSPSDERHLNEIVEKFAESGYRLRDLCAIIVASDAFRSP